MKKLFLLAALLLLAACDQQGSNASSAPQADEVYHRVMKSGVLRCGYSVWPPLFKVDPNTGEKGGIVGDMMVELAKRYGLKIEWVEELGWGTVTEALEQKRVDAACAGYWANTSRSKYVYFTVPLFYSPTFVWMRGDDTRNPETIDTLDDPAWTAGHVDGSAEGKAIAIRFPKAKTFTIPELMPSSDLFEALKAGKLDFVVMDYASVADFLNKNPGALKMMFPNDPVSILPDVMMVPGGENRLKSLFDNAIREMQYDGTVDRILEKNGAAGMYPKSLSKFDKE
ncbi:MAG: substrate-binding periplasmic protein [Bdellovibrionales bacterium]